MNYQGALAYIKTIHNPRKRAYARSYWEWLNGIGDEPRPILVGTMAAQAVRIWLNGFYQQTN